MSDIVYFVELSGKLLFLVIGLICGMGVVCGVCVVLIMIMVILDVIEGFVDIVVIRVELYMSMSIDFEKICFDICFF